MLAHVGGSSGDGLGTLLLMGVRVELKVIT